MKTLSCFRLVAFCWLLTTLALAAENSSAKSTEAPSTARSLAGSYVGNWQSGPDGGQLRIKLGQDDAVWTAEASFTVGESQIPAKVISVLVNGTKLELVLGWEVEGTSGESRLTGESTGEKFDGTYESKTSDGTSSGTWSVSRA